MIDITQCLRASAIYMEKQARHLPVDVVDPSYPRRVKLADKELLLSHGRAMEHREKTASLFSAARAGRKKLLGAVEALGGRVRGKELVNRNRAQAMRAQTPADQARLGNWGHLPASAQATLQRLDPASYKQHLDNLRIRGGV